MRHIISLLRCGCLFLAFLATCAVAQTSTDNRSWPVKLEKNYSKSYPVGSEKVHLSNRFGAMDIQIWDKNEVKVEAVASVGAQSEEYAKSMLENIQITDEKTDSIRFQTNIKSMNSSWEENKGGYEMRINWKVYVPANAKICAQNDFGPMTIGDFKGEAELCSRYGSLQAGKLANARKVTVEFGRLTVESLTNTMLTCRYSRVDISSLSGEINAKFDFCNSIDLPLNNNLKKLDLKNNYTSLYVVLDRSFAGTYDIATTNARVSTKSDISISEEKRPDNTYGYNPNHKYTGSFGKGGNSHISIKSNFGNIRLL